MKKYSVIAAALLWSTLAACKNPYIIHNLERPVYLHNIEIRSDIIGDADPSHPLDEAFQRDRRNYTATVPAPVTRVTIIGHPEEGAEVAVSGGATQLFPGKELTVTLTVRKQYRTDTVYTVRIVKGLPEASIQGLALYVDIPAPVNNSQRLDDYEPDNYVSNFLFSRGNYEVKVPEYTNDLAIVVRSFIHAPISEVWYEFKDHAGNTIGSTGRIPAPGYKAPGMPADIAPASLPAWWENPAAPVHGDIRFYPGGGPSEAASTWFGKGLVDSSDPNPLGKGKAAEIHITVKAPNLGDKTYVLKLTREPGSTYLGGITVQQIEQSGGSVVITGGTVQAPAAVVSGNRLVGSFAGTVTDYDARLSPAARALRIELTEHNRIPLITTPPPPPVTYAQYYVDGQGDRFWVNSGGVHAKWIPADPSAPSDFPGPWQDQAAAPWRWDFPFDTTDANYANYVATGIYIKVNSVWGEKIYRVTARRQKDNAVLNNIDVKPFTVTYAGEAGALTNFIPAMGPYTVSVDPGKTHGRIVLDNGTNGTAQRIITVTYRDIGNAAVTVTLSRSGPDWVDNSSVNRGPVPAIDVPLVDRVSQVDIRVDDSPTYNVMDYTLFLLKKGSHSIITPRDEDNDGKVQAVFALNPNITAADAFQGEVIELNIRANLGWFIDWTYNSDGFQNGVRCVTTPSGYLSMGGAGVVMKDGSNPADPANRKKRTYRFAMPDASVTFEVKYRETAAPQVKTAYVAPASQASRSGGYGDGPDGRTAASWGTASSDLQAVINSWNNGNFNEIWILGAQNEPYRPTENYSAWKAQIEAKTDYRLGNINGKEDAAFLLRTGLRIYGGFEETDSSKDTRGPNAAQKTILSGLFADGSQAHHVVLAVDADGAELNGLTIENGMGAPRLLDESPDTTLGPAANYITVRRNISGYDERRVSRQRGGGVFNINSSFTLNNVIIRGNTSTLGGGMYTVSRGRDANPQLDNVRFDGNTALEAGGGMYNRAASNACSPAVRNSVFENNAATVRGGGLYNAGGGCEPSVRETRFERNTAGESGGGIYNGAGSSLFRDITLGGTAPGTGNSAPRGGAGIDNSGGARFFNLTVQGNVSSGAGISNSGNLRMTSASLKNNAGPGLVNSGTAVLTNTTIDGNAGDGIFNGGSLVLANVIISGNSRGLANRAERSRAAAVLGNVSIRGNTGAGIYNEYEGAPDLGTGAGSVDLLLVNTEISGNGGRAVHNYYFRASGSGVNVTFKNATITGNGGGIYTQKGTANMNNDAEYPVYLRFHNTVVYGNGGENSKWEKGSAPFNPHQTGDDHEIYRFSLIENLTAADGDGNLAGNLNPLLDGSYRPLAGSPLRNKNSYGLYRANPWEDFLHNELYWKAGISNSALRDLLGSGLLVYLGGLQLEPKGIDYFLVRDNGFNRGDPRGPVSTGPDRPRTGPDIDIGAYQH